MIVDTRSAENYATGHVPGAISVPIGDTLALRVAGQAVDRDGYLSDGYDDERGFAGRASLLVNNMVEQGELDDAELNELRSLLEKKTHKKNNP